MADAKLITEVDQPEEIPEDKSIEVIENEEPIEEAKEESIEEVKEVPVEQEIVESVVIE